MESIHTPARFGVAGEATGYLFNPAADLLGRRDAIGFGDDAFSVRLIDRHLANEIIIANHYSQRVYRGSTLHLGVWIGGEMLGVLQYGFAMNARRQLRWPVERQL